MFAEVDRGPRGCAAQGFAPSMVWRWPWQCETGQKQSFQPVESGRQPQSDLTQSRAYRVDRGVRPFVSSNNGPMTCDLEN